MPEEKYVKYLGTADRFIDNGVILEKGGVAKPLPTDRVELITSIPGEMFEVLSDEDAAEAKQADEKRAADAQKEAERIESDIASQAKLNEEQAARTRAVYNAESQVEVDAALAEVDPPVAEEGNDAENAPNRPQAGPAPEAKADPQHSDSETSPRLGRRS